MDQQWVVDILLHDACAPCRTSILGDNALEFAPILRHLNSNTAVGALARLCDPDIVRITMLLIVLLESKEVGIIEALLNVESDWERVERILANGLIIVLHIYKEGFLVA